MTELATNRDLYIFISELLKLQHETKCTLREYLENLRRLAQPLRTRDTFSLAEVTTLLQSAFERDAVVDEKRAGPTEAFMAWERMLDRQIVDLKEMHEAGILEDEYRYFGIDAPRGSRWYNFDVRTYLECATVGTFGGWEEGDDTGRVLVPGPVAVLDGEGGVESVDPRDLVVPAQSLAQLDWNTFIDFLDAGQSYE